MSNKLKIVIGVLIALVVAGGLYFVYTKYSKKPMNENSKSVRKEEKNAAPEEVKIDTSNIKVTTPAPQNSNLDTTQIENEMNKLDLETDPSLNSDQLN